MRGGWLLLALVACGSRSPASNTPIVPDRQVATGAIGDLAVTIPSGATMLDVFAILDAAGVAHADALTAHAREPRYLSDQGLGGDSVEGYLYPGDYRFDADMDPEAVLTALIARHREAWRQLVAAAPDAPRALSDRDLVVLASLVEAETPDPSERPRMAQVFLNRLTDPDFTPHRLEDDAAVRYGCWVPVVRSAACRDWDRTDRLHRTQLDDPENPYNTYTHEGLPPGPVDSPGDSSLAAVLAPDGSDYLYSVPTADGHHLFARTFEEHERNVEQVLRSR